MFPSTRIHTYVYYQSMYVCTYVWLLFLFMWCMQMMSDADELFMRSSDNQRPRSKPVHRRNKVHSFIRIHTFYIFFTFSLNRLWWTIEVTCTPHVYSMFMYSTNVHTYVLLYSTITYIMYSHLLQSCGVPSASGKAKPGVHYRLNARDIPFILGTVS